MNYSKHYQNLMDRAKTRDLPKPYERHHIVPRCMGGTNCKDNLVRLTPEEHYVAHQLLVKMYPGNIKLIYAVKMMTVSNSRVIRNNKMFGWIRKSLAEVQKECRPPSQKGKKQSAEHIEKRINPLRGRITPIETRQQQSKSHTGKRGTRNGAILTEETKKKLSISVAAVEKISCEHCEIISSPGNYKRWHGNNCRNKNDRS